MNTYHKINTIFKREQQNGGKLIFGEYSSPEFEYLKDNIWIGTEKIDGTNIRVIWEDNTLSFKGKTDNAQMPPKLSEALKSLFSIDKMIEQFGDVNVCLYGEGYGSKIQGCGSRYIKDSNDFILFDIKIGNFWLKREDLEKIAIALNIGIVPIVFEGTINEAIERVKAGEKSLISEDKELLSEGLILKPKIELVNRKGDRVITKIKHKDFK